MPLTDRNIVITPSGPLGSGTTEATIRFTGANPTNGLVGTSTSASTFIRVLDDGSISFEGSTGQFKAITNSVSGSIFQVNDKSGIPSIDITDTGNINIAKYQGTVYLGNNVASTNTTSGSLQVLGGAGISGNLNIGGSFAMNANLGVGGAGATYGITVSTTTNIAGYFYDVADNSSIALQIGASTYPLGIGLNSYNNVGTTYVSATGHHAQIQLGTGLLNFLISSASQSANAIATQVQGLSLSATGATVPLSTDITVSLGVASTGTGAIITYGGISAGGGIVTNGDAYHNSIRIGRGAGSISSNTVIGNAAGANLLTGGGNLLIGFQTGNALTSAANNTAIGYQALLAQTATGGNNVAIGYQAMYTSNNSSMINNVAIGYRSLGLGNGGFNQNTAIGYQTLGNLASGASNTAIGYNSGNQLTSGSQNVTIGYNSGNALGSQNNVTIIGSATGSGVENGRIILSDGAANVRIEFNGTSGDARIYSTTAANGTTGVGSLRVDGGVSIASGLTLGGALYAGGSAGTNGYFLQTTATGVQWAQAGVSVTDDNATNSPRYITFTSSVSGAITTMFVSSSKLTYNPSTGIITGAFGGPLNGTVGATTANTGNFTTLGATSLQVTNGGSVHNIAGPSNASGALNITNGVSNGANPCLTVGGSGDINITSGGSLFFGNYSYAAGTYLKGAGTGEWGLYRTGTQNLQSNGTGAVQVNGILYVTGDLYTNYSDVRLKNIVAPITGAVAKIRQLEGFVYTASDLAISLGQGKEGVLRVGLSAQSVLNVQPEAVGLAGFDADENGNSKSGNNYLSVQYEKLVPLLTEGVKENADEIDALKAEIAELKALVAQLMNK
jgi:hypothetical protein